MKNMKARIQQLEQQAMDKKPFVPTLIWISGLPDSQTREEAIAEYEKRHGFDLPPNAPAIEIQTYDASKQYNQKL